MATTLSANLQIRDAIIQMSSQLLMSESIFQQTVAKLEKLQSDTAPVAKNPAFQEELNKVHAIFQKVVPLAMANITSQYQASKDFGPRISAEAQKENPNLPVISELLEALQSQLTPLQTQHKKLEAIMGLLTFRIVTLTTEQNPPAAQPHQWEQLEASI